MAELFGGEVFRFPFVYVVYREVGEVFVSVDFYCVQWVVSNVLWFGDVLRYWGWGSFLGLFSCGGWCYCF